MSGWRKSIQYCLRSASPNCRNMASALEIDTLFLHANTPLRKFLTLPHWCLVFVSCPPVMSRAGNLHECSSLIPPGMPIWCLSPILIHNREGPLHVGCTRMEPSSAVKTAPSCQNTELSSLLTHHTGSTSSKATGAHTIPPYGGCGCEVCPVPAPSLLQMSGHMLLFCQ